jgi:hypothetical protein
MNDETSRKLARIALADPDPRVREDLAYSFLRLAEVVDRFDDGDHALSYCESTQPEIALISLACWSEPEPGIEALKVARDWGKTILIVSYRKILPTHLGQLRKMKIENVLGHPIDPLFLYRLASDRFGVHCRRYDRVNHRCDVYWGVGASKEVVGYTADISRGGIQLVSERKFNKNTSLFLGIQLDDESSVEVRGEIVKIDTSTFAPAIGYGVSFADLPSTAGLLLQVSVSNFSQMQLEAAGGTATGGTATGGTATGDTATGDTAGAHVPAHLSLTNK